MKRKKETQEILVSVPAEQAAGEEQGKKKSSRKKIIIAVVAGILGISVLYGIFSGGNTPPR